MGNGWAAVVVVEVLEVIDCSTVGLCTDLVDTEYFGRLADIEEVE